MCPSGPDHAQLANGPLPHGPLLWRHLDVFFLIFGYWTIYQFMALYLELKRCRIKDGSWYETEGKHERVLQIFDVFGFYLGTWATVVAATLAFIALIGVLMTQTSLAYIWEKIWRIHTKPWYIRIPVRLPPAGFIWFLAILCPFYGPIKSLYSSLAIPFLEYG